ncbi:cytochrome b [Psychrobacter sp. AOP22-C1-22]|uniref:cytochrome b n=1 Tax=unclassified Psychrobacter TaxID=196806 RepID=UPI00178806C2|nr:cytochrome b [Psychrobacter sp. FME6]MBE0406649.1 cytochrome b [Psychrobacter sp. FME6]
MNKFQSHIQKWPTTSRLLHWISALLLLVTWCLMLLYGNSDNSLYLNLHKAFGMSVLFWMIARLINRLLTNTPPSVPMPVWQSIISKLTHFALYALLIAMPMAGLLMSVYGGHPVDIFGLFEIPVFVTPDRSAARFYNDVHTDIIWPMIIAFTLAHIGGALYHQFIKKDNLIKRII